MKNYKNIPENANLEPTDAFGEDLVRLYQVDDRVPPDVDDQICQHARDYFQREVQTKRSRSRILWPVVAAAAGLVLVASIILPLLQSSNVQSTDSTETTQPRQQMLAQDIDASGRVDIVDCLVLARHIESGETLDPAWDFTGDGRLDQEDVDLVASAVVSLSQGVWQ